MDSTGYKERQDPQPEVHGSGPHQPNRGRHRLEHWQNIALLLAIYDIIVVNLAYYLALWFRYDCRYTAIPREYLFSLVKFTPIYTIFCLVAFWYLRLYKSLWRFASYSELIRVGLSSVITGAFHTIAITVRC